MQDFPLQKSTLNVEILNSVASIAFEQIYLNKLQNPIECIYQFPVDKTFAVSDVTIEIGDKVIQTKIMEKEEAKQLYLDQTAAGNTAAMVSYDEEVSDILQLNLGSVQPDTVVKVCVKMTTILGAISKQFFNFNFPVEFFP